STHSANTESAIKRADYVVWCIRHPNKAALFVGLYAVASTREVSVEECLARSKHKELMSLGMSGIFATEGRTRLQEFDLRLSDWHSEWIGRLILEWSGLERSWYRWAHRNDFPVRAITEESLLRPTMPSWEELLLTWQELSLLPESWAAALRQWRGIYLITDRIDGKQYVGSAYGGENILQRWRNYARTGHGGNKLLRERNPNDFCFSILQRVSPDAPDSDVVDLERTWKVRLQTRAPAGLNEN
ncbi:MAG TPA: GIY-YIG nuclease family protein, partial [Sphingomicrobium sp.]|nr:GIY-YIG nuclease family protein [Sphingomicrobium sp.]